jgi:pyruvate/2-oxoglutarate dehydrogenase complex dihydrolipoamide acyltransferase (E2) component
MTQACGRTIPLSLPRRLITDLVHFAAKVPTVPVQRRMNVQQVKMIRAQLNHRPSWCAIFTKAYAHVASTLPELRRAYLAFPTAHLYEHPFSIASIAIERAYQEENAVFFAHLRAPEQQSLASLDEHLQRFKHDPVESIGLFRRALTFSKLPRWLRRFAWWFGLNSSGGKRAKRMGTFGVSVYSSLGAESLHPLSPLTTTLNYGVIQADGMVDVRIIYDHRVMDGATVARALELLERTLHGVILAELRERLREEQAVKQAA